MAHKERNTTRLARVGTWVVEVWCLTLTALKAFLNFQEDDGLLVKGEKVANFALRRTLYLFLDYGLWVGSIAIFTTMKAFGLSLPMIFVAIWAYEFMAAGVLVSLYEKTGLDLSLGVDFRRAKDAVHERSRAAGFIVLVAVIVLAIVWTGPEKIIIFFRKELGPKLGVILAIFALTCIQALVWTVLYDLGYGLVAELW